MDYVFKVFRFDPAVDKEPYFKEYRLLEVEPTDKVLDCLNRIRWELDPGLSFRMSCAHGVCGSDGMKIDGVCALACQKLIRDYPKGEMTIEPLPNFPVIKDLIVDLDVFFEKYRAIKPYLLNDKPAPERERLQDADDRDLFDEAIRCILCACCTASCPVSETNEEFLGPAALLKAFRYLFDSRDQADSDRMALLDDEKGIWGCKGHGKCTEVCPKEIDVRKKLGSVKKRIYDDKKART